MSPLQTYKNQKKNNNENNDKSLQCMGENHMAKDATRIQISPFFLSVKILDKKGLVVSKNFLSLEILVGNRYSCCMKKLCG
jgi:hypothetical protein